MFDILTWNMQEEELLSEGYHYGTPAPECEQDRQIVETRACEGCGSTLRFVPFVRWERFVRRLSYRAFAVCRTCNKAAEF